MFHDASIYSNLERAGQQQLKLSTVRLIGRNYWADGSREADPENEDKRLIYPRTTNSARGVQHTSVLWNTSRES